MKFLRNTLDKVKHDFEKGGKWEKFYYVYEAFDTFAFAPNTTTNPRGAQIRDGNDMKRLMMTVIISMIPASLFGIYNVGHQHFLAIGEQDDRKSKNGIGLQQVFTLVVVSYATRLVVEFIFATLLRHPVNECFLVTWLLIPLVMSPDISYSHVAVANIFSIEIDKEVIGGT